MNAHDIPFPPVVEEILARAASAGASDVHLASDQERAWIRQGGLFAPEPDDPRTPGHVVEQCALWNGGSEASRTHLLVGSRWRVTSYHSEDGWRVTFRIIPESPADFDLLGLPPFVRGLASYQDGLIITAGATGSGKTTTLASLIDIIVRSRPVHLLTIEDPVEYHYSSITALVTHRELGGNLSPEDAWATAMRADPDVVLYGEMRRPSDIDMCMELASSGHLVFTSIHARDCGTVCERIASATGDSGRSMLAQVLRAVITQKLIPSAQDPRRRYVAAEIMMVDHTYRALIRPSGRLTSIETQLANEQRSMDWALAKLVDEGKVTYDDAMAASLVPQNFLNNANKPNR